MIEKLSLAQGVKSRKSLRQVLVLFSISFPALISGSILIRDNFKRVLAEETRRLYQVLALRMVIWIWIFLSLAMTNLVHWGIT